MGHRIFYGVAVGAFVFSLFSLGCSVALLCFAGGRESVVFTLFALPWMALGMLAAWVGHAVKGINVRLNRLESPLRQRGDPSATEMSSRFSGQHLHSSHVQLGGDTNISSTSALDSTGESNQD